MAVSIFMLESVAARQDADALARIPQEINGNAMESRFRSRMAVKLICSINMWLSFKGKKSGRRANDHLNSSNNMPKLLPVNRIF